VPLDCWFGGTTLLRLSSGTVIEALPPAAGSRVTIVVLVELFTVKVTLPVVGSRSGLKATFPVRPVGVDEAEAVMEAVLDVGSDDEVLGAELAELGADEDPLLADEPLLVLGLPEAEVELPGDAEDEAAVAEELLGGALLEPEELADAELDGDEDELDGDAEEDELGEELADCELLDIELLDPEELLDIEELLDAELLDPEEVLDAEGELDTELLEAEELLDIEGLLDAEELLIELVLEAVDETLDELLALELGEEDELVVEAGRTSE
jgi:hypothetical protein